MKEKEVEEGHEERLRELRERLYSRTRPPEPQIRKELKDEPHEVAAEWRMDMPVEYTPPAPVAAFQDLSLSMKKNKRSYRIKIIVGGLIFFCVALLLSGSFLLFGKNEISGKNIDIEVNGPSVVGGGEELDFQVTISNKNAVTIESATLIVEYPYGTQSAEEGGKELTRDRKPLAPLKPGEVTNIPLSARVFGEENEEKKVLISMEYRVEGSNATFYKEVDPPYRFTISSSPIVLSVEQVSKSASGQDVEFEVTVTSNSPSEIERALLKMESPQGFDFIESKPNPASGRDTWGISNLKPQEKQVISIKGSLIGAQDETKVFTFSVGVPNERDIWSMASVFSVQKEEIQIEEPFLDMSVDINGSDSAEVAIAPGATAQVVIDLENTLSTTLYDGVITVDLSGSGLGRSEISVSDGYYDSSQNTIKWTSADTDSLNALQPGDSSTVRFSLSPQSQDDRTPQITFKVSALGNRVSEGNVSERLSGTVERSIKVESVASVSSAALYSIGAFTNTGPVPPRAESVSTFTLRMSVQNGTNAVTDGVVTARLPQYVTWLDISSPSDAFTYNPSTREVTWDVGSIAARGTKEASLQVSLKPSTNQVGQSLTLLEEQRFRATDRFTGTTLRSEAPALTTKLSLDPKYANEEGQVESKRD